MTDYATGKLLSAGNIDTTDGTTIGALVEMDVADVRRAAGLLDERVCIVPASDLDALRTPSPSSPAAVPAGWMTHKAAAEHALGSVNTIIAHLSTADVQVVDADDKVIVGHLRDALAIAKGLRADMAAWNEHTSSPSVPAGWMPIETAPRDGTDVLLYAPAGEWEGKPTEARTTVGHWTTDDECRRQIGDCGGECRCPEYDEIDPYWLSWDGGFLPELPPTHWMPLPPAPGAAPPPSQDVTETAKRAAPGVAVGDVVEIAGNEGWMADHAGIRYIVCGIQMQRSLDRVAPASLEAWLIEEALIGTRNGGFDGVHVDHLRVVSPAARSVSAPAPADGTALSALQTLVGELDSLMDGSEGVAGLHKNGDIAPWGDLMSDGAYPWLGSLDDARRIASARPVAELTPTEPAVDGTALEALEEARSGLLAFAAGATTATVAKIDAAIAALRSAKVSGDEGEG
jgi:hypothetical protein